VHAYVSLGDLTPDDVDVQVLHGRVREELDDLVDVHVSSLKLVESFEANRHRFDGEVTLASTGPFGYTVRVVPRNSHLASVAELGLVALPA
jgi:starch phosphorylase